jgi:outer membrane protein TolC
MVFRTLTPIFEARSTVRRTVWTALLYFAIGAASGTAQVNSFPKPDYFRQSFIHPATHVELAAPVRLQDFVVPVKDGKVLELSLKDYLSLVMSNNTDIAIQRLTVSTSEDAVLRSFSIFDPKGSASWSTSRSKSPVSNLVDIGQVGTSGISTVALNTLRQPANFNWSQLLPSGALYNVTFGASKLTTSSSSVTYNPSLNASLAVSFSQPLLRNRGNYINRLGIVIARGNLRQTQFQLRDRVLQIIQDAENAYWDVVLAHASLRVQEEALKLAEEALKRAQQELDLGAMSPLDIYNPQQQQATAEIAVSQARFSLAQVENTLRMKISADLDPEVRKLPINLTESAEPPENPAPLDADAAIKHAISMRPDLQALKVALEVDDLQIEQAANQLRPDLQLTGNYSSQGLGGIFNYSSSGRLATIPGGFGDALGQLFGFGYPIYTFGLTLNLPIRNHTASANYADQIVSKKSDALTARRTEQQIRLDVLNAISQTEAAKNSVRLAKVAKDFSQKYLDAEQKKYELGTSQIFFVLQAQTALVNADSAVVQNEITYRRNMLNLLRKTGELLDERGIALQ